MIFRLYSRLNRSWESKSIVNVNNLFMFPQKFVIIHVNKEAISLFSLNLVSFRFGYGDLWHPVFQLKVLSLLSIYDVYYAENK